MSALPGSQDASRAAFEDWFNPDDSANYWDCWQASRKAALDEALEISKQASIRSALPELPERDTRIGGDDFFLTETVREYGDAKAAHARKGLADLVKKVHAAKGRYHSQIAMCDLYDACGLPNERPKK